MGICLGKSSKLAHISSDQFSGMIPRQSFFFFLINYSLIYIVGPEFIGTRLSLILL